MIRSDKGAHYVAKAGSNISLLRADNAARITIDGGEWDGDMRHQSLDNGGAILDFVASDYVTVRNTYVHDSYLVGIRTMGTNNQVVGNRFGAGRRDAIFMTNASGGIAYATRAAHNLINRSAQSPPSQSDTVFGWGIDVQSSSADMVGTEVTDNTIRFPSGSGASASNGTIQVLGYRQVQYVQRGAIIARNELSGGGESIASASLLESRIVENKMIGFTAACIEVNMNSASPIKKNTCDSALATTGIYEDNGTVGSAIIGNTVTLTKADNSAVKGIFLFKSSGLVSDNDVTIAGGKGAGVLLQSVSSASEVSNNRIVGRFDYGVEVLEPKETMVSDNHIWGSKIQGVLFASFGFGKPRFLYAAIGNELRPTSGGNIAESFPNATPTLTGSSLKSNISTSGLIADVQH